MYPCVYFGFSGSQINQYRYYSDEGDRFVPTDWEVIPVTLGGGARGE